MASNREFQIFAKPVGAVCNLACHYCYYLETDKKIKDNSGNSCSDVVTTDKSKYEFDGSSPVPVINSDDSIHEKMVPWRLSSIMSDEILERYIIQHIKASTGSDIIFTWHGGEPLMAGIEFYRKAIDLQKKYIPKGRIIINGIQTNGTLLNDDWCKFLSREKFFVGISIDGPEKIHNFYRQNLRGQPSFSKVMNGIELLRKYAVTFEVLCVVHAGNAGKPLEVYRFLRGLGAGYMTFLPLVIRDPKSNEGVTKHSVPSEEFGNFMISVFDEWVANDIGKVKIQLFEEAARTAFGQDHTLCIFKETCGNVPVVERNGDFYSCDHYVDPDHLVGNIRNKTIEEMLDSEAQMAFGRAKLDSLPWYCIACEVLSMCNGECPKNRFIDTPNGEEGLNYLCTGYRKFFNHCRPFIDAIATAWDQNNKNAVTPVLHAAGQSKKPNRNDPCLCGSGKKYKHCCIKK